MLLNLLKLIINPKLKVSYYLYLKLGIFFQKVQPFFNYFSGSYTFSVDNRYIVPLFLIESLFFVAAGSLSGDR